MNIKISKPIVQLLTNSHITVAFFLALAFSIGVFTTTMPVWNAPSWDSSMFLTFGKGILTGKVIYRDLLDNKGPILYLIQALGLVPFAGLPTIQAAIGVWIVEFICLFFSLHLLAKIAYKIAPSSSFFIQVFYLIASLPFIEVGNYSEEYANFFTIIAFYVMINYLDREPNVPPFRYSFSIGILFIITFLTRPNNALTIFALVATLSFYYLIKKEFKILFDNVIGFLGGVFVIFIPIILYLSFNNALNDWATQTFFANMGYAGTTKTPFLELLLTNYGLKSLLFFILITTSSSIFLRYRKDNKYDVFAIGILVAGIFTFFSTFISTYKFPHYQLNIIPVFTMSVLLLVAIVSTQWTNKTLFTTIIAIYLSLNCLLSVFYTRELIFTKIKNLIHFIPTARQYIRSTHQYTIEKLIEDIPHTERNSIYLEYMQHELPTTYLRGNIIPAKRLFAGHWIFKQVIPGMSEEYIKYFYDNPPKWLVTQTNLIELDDTDELKEHLNTIYKLQEIGEEQYHLYRLQDIKND